MDCILLIRANNHFVLYNQKRVESSADDRIPRSKKFFHEQIFQGLKNGQTVSRKHLAELIDERSILYNDNYLVGVDDLHNGYVVIKPLEKKGWLSPIIYRKSRLDKMLKVAHNYARQAQIEFKLERHKTLIHRLLGNRKNLDSCIESLAKYCLCDRYAFWVYNPRTKTFCSTVCSHKLSQAYVTESDNTSLFEFTKGEADIEVRAPRRGCVNESFAHSMQTLNRIKLKLGRDEEIGIMDFLYIAKDFHLPTETLKQARNFLETKYLEYRQMSQVALHKVQQYFSEYEAGKLNEFLHGLTTKICNELCFQACSIWLIDPDKQLLRIAAISDLKQDGKPKEEASYDSDKSSLTKKVYDNGKVLFSYDLEKDPRNSRIHNDCTPNKGTNWIGMPILSERRTWGVLRVKNKHEIENRSKITNFMASDFHSIDAICTHLSNILDLEEVHAKYVKKNITLFSQGEYLKGRFEDLNNTLKVFVHEIRSPIFTFGTSTQRIKMLIRRSELKKEEKDIIVRKVDDITIMGERLTFLADTFYFEEMIRVKIIKRLNVMQDIIFPVYNIVRDYIYRVHDITVKLDEVSLSGQQVYGDKRVLNMVLNALIDNASKYSLQPGGPIRISGENRKEGDYFFIAVSNIGLKIHKKERNDIFKNGFRGAEVLEQNVRGTGIGLYMSKEMMKALGGDLILQSYENPIIFKMQIPKRKLVVE